MGDVSVLEFIGLAFIEDGKEGAVITKEKGFDPKSKRWMQITITPQRRPILISHDLRFLKVHASDSEIHYFRVKLSEFDIDLDELGIDD